MSRDPLPHGIPWQSVLLSAITVASLTASQLPAGANMAPDAMVYFNVRPAGPPEVYCVVDTTDCGAMHASTEAQGRLEFQIFIEPQQWLHGVIPVWEFWANLTWPESWTLVDAVPCSGAGAMVLEPSGPGQYRLGVGWPCVVPDGVFLAATLVLDVQGYGRLDTSGGCELWLDCPSHFVVYPTSHYAEAGTGCEYTDQPCASWDFICIPNFASEELRLTAPEGGVAHGEVEFTVDGEPFPSCAFSVNSEAPWATAYVELTGGPYDYQGVLFVETDASDLEPGVYESDLQLVFDRGGRLGADARCVTVILTVEPASSVVGPVAVDPAAVPLGLRLIGASPSAGPFVFRYENPMVAHVRCGVYDAAGREVARLLEGEQPRGQQKVTWRATDAEGHHVRLGVYLVRLALDGQVQSSRVVVVR